MTEAVLYVVATPIGNLGDMVPRAIEVLQTVELIAAEDKRHSSRLMSHFDIKTPMVSYHDHSDDKQVQQLLNRLQRGESVALISDAGTPLISDPGYRLVSKVRSAGIKVVPIPGACALIAALSVSGMPSDRFTFEGFLPAKSGQRQNRLADLKDESRTMIFYEAPHRILACLKDMSDVFGENRCVVVAREITKTFETLLDGSIEEVIASITEDENQQRGEMVVLVEGAPATDSGMDKESVRIMTILLQELSVKQASAIAAEITGLKKKVLYQWAIERNSG